MAVGSHKGKQKRLWLDAGSIAKGPGHPFYEKLEGLLRKHHFDSFAEEQCRPYYAEGVGRPSIPPGVYFRMMFIGYFEGLESERGICWRVADSMSLRQFLGYEASESTPDHSSLCRIRQRYPQELHQEVFQWVLHVLAAEGLVKGKTIGVDSTTLEANAALRSIVRRDTGEKYEDYLERLAKESGIETPTREDIARLDRKRAGKGSNAEWEHPHDPDAGITKMKDGRTHLAHKAEHAIDMQTQAIITVSLSRGDEADCHTVLGTLEEAAQTLRRLQNDEKVGRKLHDKPLDEVVGDKGYHTNEVLEMLDRTGSRSYVSEPNRGRRRWSGKETAKRAVYGNRRRIRGGRGRSLQRRRGEVLERAGAHLYDTGGMRRLHLRERGNIHKRLSLHASAFNLSLVMRKVLGVGTPRGLADRLGRCVELLLSLLSALRRHLTPLTVR
jgi:transposase